MIDDDSAFEKEILEQALEQIDACRYFYEKGDSIKLLNAIDLCSQHRIVMPDWVVSGLRKAMDKYEGYEVRTLDEAFGVKRPKGLNLNKMKRWHKHAFGVYAATARAARDDVAIDNHLFDGVAKRIGTNRDDCWDMYRWIKERHGWLNSSWWGKKNKA